MTRVIKDNRFVPITILEVPMMKVVGHKTLERDGYDAIVVGIHQSDDAPTIKK